MKTKKLLSLVLTIVMAVSMTAALGIPANAGKLATLHAEATCDKYPDVKHVLVTAVDSSNVTFTLYDIDGTKTENQTLPVSYFTEQPAVGEWCFGSFMYYGKCDGNHEKSGGNETDTFLDLDSTTTDILEKKELEQNYNLTVTTLPSRSGAVTKVKLSWEISDINAVRMDNMVWDTAELKWVAASSNTTIMDKGTAKFTLENYSSVKIDATASFQAETGFKGTASYDVTGGKVTLDTANGSDTYSKTNVPTKVINATVTTDEDDFNGLTATTTAAKYGTYTVTISKYIEKKVAVKRETVGDNFYLYAELTGFEEGEHTYEWTHNWNGAKVDGDMTAIPSGITVEDNGAKLNLGSSKWNYYGNYRVTVDGISSELTETIPIFV